MRKRIIAVWAGALLIPVLFSGCEAIQEAWEEAMDPDTEITDNPNSSEYKRKYVIHVNSIVRHPTRSGELEREIPTLDGGTVWINTNQLFSSKNIKGRERERFDKQIHSLTIRSIISSESVNLDKGREVSAIYVMEVQLNIQDCDDGNLLLLDRLGHKTVYVLTYGDVSKMAVVEDILFQTGWGSSTDQSIELQGLNLDDVWASIVRTIGALPPDVPMKEAVSEVRRRREYDTKIADLERKFQKERQNHEKRKIHAEIQRLKKERDLKPEPVRDETSSPVDEIESKPT